MDLLLEQIQGLDEALRLLQADVRIVQTENWELRKALVHLHVQSDAIRSEGTATAHSDDRAAVATSSNAGDYPDDLQSALDTYKSQLKKKMKAFTRTLTEEVQSIANQVRSNSDTLTEWSQRLHCIDSSSNKDQLTFKGCNVYISNGLGMTGSDNGRGNLILGYNEAGNGPTLLPTDRNGSHNLIVGPGHRYTSHGSILAGVAHSVSGEYSSCIAGECRALFGSLLFRCRLTAHQPTLTLCHAIPFRSVATGEYNTVTASYALAAGGESLHACGARCRGPSWDHSLTHARLLFAPLSSNPHQASAMRSRERLASRPVVSSRVCMGLAQNGI